tara:strand:- start:3287 stop:4150 length:864 start_codon:yes stop_codon:yes gene_type:complete
MGDYNSFDYYIAELGKLEPFTRDEEKSHFESYSKVRDKKTRSKKLIKEGERCYNEILKRNLRLVVRIAKKYMNLGIPLQDLVAEGNLGLITAVKRYDYKNGAKFSTYASFWIKQYMRRSLSNDSRVIRLPSGLIEQRNKVAEYISNYERVNNREPSIKQISKKLKISRERIIIILETFNTPLSLDYEFQDDSEETFGSVLEDEKQIKPSDFTQLANEISILNDALKELPVRERYVLERRYGLNNNDKYTLEAIGDHFNVTRERVRQLETVAMWRLKNIIEEKNQVNA